MWLCVQFAFLYSEKYIEWRRPWLPVLSEDVEADVAVEVDVRVVDLGRALHLRGFVGVRAPEVERGPSEKFAIGAEFLQIWQQIRSKSSQIWLIIGAMTLCFG